MRFFGLILFSLLLNLPMLSYTQKVSDVDFEQKDKIIEINYKLIPIPNASGCFVELLVSLDGGKTFSGPLQKVSGDVGYVASIGVKRIIWNVVDEYKKVRGNVMFQIVAKPLFTGKERKAPIKRDISDVDIDIPKNNIETSYRFALVVGNEDYSSYQEDLDGEVNVDYAENDALIFKEYLTKTLGVPEQNVELLINAKSIELNRAIDKINSLIKVTNGKAEVFIYYAGHGLPDNVNKDTYIIPVDVSSKDLKYAIKLKDMYSKLSEYPAKLVTVFLDACFSGGARNQGLIAARAVRIAPKEDVVKGNIVVFSASSGIQSSFPYKEKSHGMFTYYVLKKLKESQGNISYGNFYDYLKEQVGVQSIIINDKEQTPHINVGFPLRERWSNITFN